MRQGSKFRYPHGCSVFDCCSWQKSMAGEAHHLFSLGWDKAQALPQWLSFLVVTAGTFRDWLWSLPALLDLLTTKPPTKVMLSEEQPSRPSELQVLFSQCRKHVDLGRTSSESWLPRCLSGKEFACQFRRHGFYPWVGKIPWSRKWHATPSVFAWEIPMDRGAWQATVHGVAKSQTRLSTHALVLQATLCPQSYCADIYSRAAWVPNGSKGVLSSFLPFTVPSG